MKPCTILLTEFEATVSRATEENPRAAPRVRRRWRARFEGGPPHLAAAVAVGESVDVAIGQLVREAALTCDTADDVVDLVAGLFGDLTVRTADESIGRAVRAAAESPRRRNPGATVRLEPLCAAGTPSGSRKLRKGGAA